MPGPVLRLGEPLERVEQRRAVGEAVVGSAGQAAIDDRGHLRGTSGATDESGGASTPQTTATSCSTPARRFGMWPAQS